MDPTLNASLTWAGTAHGAAPCPSCEQALRVKAAKSAQGLSKCPLCGVPLFVSIRYTWRDGAPVLYRDDLRLIRAEDVRERLIASGRPGWRDWFADHALDALPGALLAGGAAGFLAMALTPDGSGVPALALGAVGFVVAELGIALRAGYVRVRELRSWNRQSCAWADRLLDSPIVAELEAASDRLGPQTGTERVIDSVDESSVVTERPDAALRSGDTKRR